MVFKSPCHQSCSEVIEKQIRKVVSEVYDTVKIETIVLHENENSPQQHQSDTQDGEDGKGPATHSFLVTVEAACHQDDKFFSDSQVNSNVQNDGTFDIEEWFDGNDGTEDASVLSGEKSLLSLSPKTSFFDAPVNNQFAGTRTGSTVDLSFFENLRRTGVEDLGMDTFDLPVGVVEGFDDSVVYPLSSDELHETINEQLDKSSPPVEEWQNSLFKDVTKDDKVKTNMSNASVSTSNSTEMMVSEFALSQAQQQHQSNEISSSWDTVAISTSHYQSTTMIPQLIRPSYCSNNPNQFTSVSGVHPANFALSTQQQQFLCPANLPAVSALITGGGCGGNGGGSSFNWTYSSAPPGGVIKPTIIRLEKIVREQKSSRKNTNVFSRPSMLLPKTSSLPSRILASGGPVPTASEPGQFPTETSKLRSRKTNHTAEPVGAVCSSRPDNATTPEGYTCQSWIIQEGLIKPREKLKKEKKAEGLQNRKDRNNGKTSEELEEAQPKEMPVTQKVKVVRYVCPICGKSYGTANGIKYHAENGHGPKSIYACNICHKEYASRHGLAAHKKSHEIQAASQALINSI